MGSPNSCGNIEIEKLFPSIVRGTIKNEPASYELDEDAGNRKRKSDCDELVVGDMTLKELQERCRTKKKKPKSGSLTNQEFATSSCMGDISSTQDYASVQVIEDGSEFEETLSFFKKKSKSRRKRSRKRVRSSSESGVSVEAVFERTPNASEISLQGALDVHEPVNVEFQISETEFSNSRNVPCFSNGCDKRNDKIRFSAKLSDKVNSGHLKTGRSIYVTSDSHSCGANEVSFECPELGEPVSLPESDTVVSGEIAEVSIPPIVSAGPISSLVGRLEDNNTCPIRCYYPTEEIPLTEDLGSGNNSSQQQISCPGGYDTVTLRPDVLLDGSFKCKAMNSGGSRHISYLNGESDSSEDTSLSANNDSIRNFGSHHISSQNCYSCFSPSNDRDSLFECSPVAKKKRSFLTSNGPTRTGAYEAAEWSSPTLPDDCDEIADIKLLETHLQLERPPKRLLSTRKVISPTSQEKLCQAVDAEELYDSKENSRSSLGKIKVTQVPYQVVEKPKSGRLESPQAVPKGILKAPHVSSVIPDDGGAECTSIHTNAQNAVAFSQLQMKDFDSLAMKLMKELKSMKDILEEALCSHACSSVPSKYTADEIRMAIENAAKTEETSTKRLSMMARDCKRFCKIMGLSEKKSDFASNYVVHKGRKKKIIFADEAGGKLCQVKVLETKSESFPVTASESGLDSASLNTRLSTEESPVI